MRKPPTNTSGKREEMGVESKLAMLADQEQKTGAGRGRTGQDKF